MLGDVPTVEAVAAALEMLPPEIPVVLDPVMVAESGAELLSRHARASMIDLVLPRATITTPNIPEARALAGAEHAHSEPEELARAVHALGPRSVVVTGGHRERPIDVFFDGEQVVELPGERHPRGAAHGSGCTHSSALAARLAFGDGPLEAARAAKRIASRAVQDGLRDVGAGTGPVDVFGLAGAGYGRRPRHGD